MIHSRKAAAPTLADRIQARSVSCSKSLMGGVSIEEVSAPILLHHQAKRMEQSQIERIATSLVSESKNLCHLAVGRIAQFASDQSVKRCARIFQLLRLRCQSADQSAISLSRVEIPSFANTECIWTLTVPGALRSTRAISLLLNPRAARLATTRSRGVSKEYKFCCGSCIAPNLIQNRDAPKSF